MGASILYEKKIKTFKTLQIAHHSCFGFYIFFLFYLLPELFSINSYVSFNWVMNLNDGKETFIN